MLVEGALSFSRLSVALKDGLQDAQPVRLPHASIILQLKPVLVAANLGRIVTLQLLTLAVLVLKHSNTCTATRL
jgi:hypothetical protein